MSENATPGLLHHVELYASDFDAAARFWGWFLPELGYREYQRWEGGRSWKRGPTYLVVVGTAEAQEDDAFDRRAPGLNHLAFHARSRRHVDEMTQTLRERGRRVLYGDRHPHAGGEDHYAVYFEGPEGLKLELVAPDESEP